MKPTKLISLFFLTLLLSSCSIITEQTVTGDILGTAAPTSSVGTKRPPATAVSGSHYQTKPSKTPQECLDELPRFDGEGSIFLVATIDEADAVPIFPVEGTTTSADVVERFSAIEELYNIKITPLKYKYDELVASLAESVITDTYIVDLVILPADKTAAFDSNGAMLIPERVAFFDFDRPYFDKSYSAAYGSYAICGDAMLKPENTVCVYYNADLADRLGIGSLYGDVAGGNWTWDRLTECAAQGWITSALPLSYPVALTSGLSYSEILGRDLSIKELDPESHSDIVGTVDKLRSFYISDDPLTSFINGNALFYIGTLADITALNDMKDAWSPLPVPNATPSVNYSTVRDYRNNDFVFMIPKYPYSPERSAQVVSAFCAASGRSTEKLKESIIPKLRVNEARLLIDLLLD